MKNHEYKILSEDSIKYLCGLIRDLASVSEGIDNINLADDKTFSNIYIKNLIDKCLEDANAEAEKLVGALTHLTCEETRRKISIANKDTERGGKIVICENKEFSSITKCSDYYGVSRSIIGDWLNHNTVMPIEWYNKGLRYAEEKSEDYEIKEEGKNSKNEIPYKSMKKEIVCEGKEFCGIKEFMNSYNISSNKRGSIVGWLSGCDPMPQEWYNKGLRYKDKNIDEYVVQKGRATGKDNKASKNVVCEGIIFDTVKQCAIHYDIKPKTMSTWLNGTRNMPQDFVNKGLKFYKEDDK